MLGKVEGWVVIESLTHTGLWVEYNLSHVKLEYLYELMPYTI